MSGLPFCKSEPQALSVLFLRINWHREPGRWDLVVSSSRSRRALHAAILQTLFEQTTTFWVGHASRLQDMLTSQPCSWAQSKYQSKHHGLYNEHASHDNGDIWIMRSNFKRHQKQTALFLLRVCNMILIFDGVSKVQQPASKANSAVFIADMQVNTMIWWQCLRTSQPSSRTDDKKGERSRLPSWNYNSHHQQDQLQSKMDFMDMRDKLAIFWCVFAGL